MSRSDLEFLYIQNLEENIIEYLAQIKNMDLRQAMDIYYKSRLSKQIFQGVFGIENMDYKYLAEDLAENEKELFDRINEQSNPEVKTQQ